MKFLFMCVFVLPLAPKKSGTSGTHIFKERAISLFLGPKRASLTVCDPAKPCTLQPPLVRQPAAGYSSRARSSAFSRIPCRSVESGKCCTLRPCFGPPSGLSSRVPVLHLAAPPRVRLWSLPPGLVREAQKCFPTVRPAQTDHQTRLAILLAWLPPRLSEFHHS